MRVPRRKGNEGTQGLSQGGVGVGVSGWGGSWEQGGVRGVRVSQDRVGAGWAKVGWGRVCWVGAGWRLCGSGWGEGN